MVPEAVRVNVHAGEVTRRAEVTGLAGSSSPPRMSTRAADRADVVGRDLQRAALAAAGDFICRIARSRRPLYVAGGRNRKTRPEGLGGSYPRTRPAKWLHARCSDAGRPFFAAAAWRSASDSTVTVPLRLIAAIVIRAFCAR